MIKNILVPTDGNQPSERAAEQAIDLAKQFDAGLHSVFVVSDPRVGFTPYESDLEPLFQSGKEFVSRICEMAEESGMSCETDVFEADQLHQGILSYAEEHVDLRLAVVLIRHELDVLSN
jgi:nucleotide-binding universal stress UspA family protein